jgi:N-acetyl sugar amidotransferase
MIPARILQTCTVCVMDNSQAELEFDAAGQCPCCRDAIRRMPHEWWPGEGGARQMARLVERLRKEGRGKPYDAMVGLSGGIDSAYLAHLMKAEHGLRLLAVHVDGGWNSAPAVRNIEAIVRGLDIDLHTIVIEWAEMRSLQLAFLRAGVLNQDFPQDHAFFASLFETARDFGIRTFLSGVNFPSECVGTPAAPNPPSVDGRHLRGVHERFGSAPLKTYPVMTFSAYLWSTRVRGRPNIEKPLDYLDYDKTKAQQVLQEHYGWRDYRSKHSESRFTKFYQDVYLPRRYGFDKRRLHLSSPIVSGQMTRDEACAELAKPAAGALEMRRDTRFVAKKLGISVEELDCLIDAPPVPHGAYPNDMKLHRALHGMRRLARNLVSVGR